LAAAARLVVVAHGRAVGTEALRKDQGKNAEQRREKSIKADHFALFSG
jgi:hypothetical protein